MKKVFTRLRYITIFCALLLTGCARTNRHAYPPSLRCTTTHQHQLPACKAQIVSREACKKYFHCDIYTTNMRVIHLSINNNSSRPFLMRGYDINLPFIEKKEVADQLINNVNYFAINCGIIGVLFSPIFLVPATLSTLTSIAHNRNLLEHINQTTISLGDYIPILPGTTVNKFIFIEKNNITHNTCLIDLYDKKNKTVVTIECLIDVP